MKYIALLRGINVSGKNKIAMADLRALAHELGLVNVSTYIQSGNLLFTSTLKAEQVSEQLREAISNRLGISIPVIVRTQSQWSKYSTGSPYPDAEAKRPNTLLLALCKKPLALSALDYIMERTTAEERVTAFKDGLWIDFPHGSGRSKLSPAVLDRACGDTVTTRNFNTVLKIANMLKATLSAE